MDNFSGINHASSVNVDQERVDSPTDLSGKTNAAKELSEEIQKQLEYNAGRNYVRCLVGEWPRKLEYENAKVTSNSFQIIRDNIKPWKRHQDQDQVRVWDITLDNNHAIVVVYLPSGQVHVLDPVIGGKQRAIVIGKIICDKCLNANDSLTIHCEEMPEHGVELGTNANPSGVCMLWCCLFLKSTMIGLDWKRDVCRLSSQELTYALVRAEYVPYTLQKALSSIPEFVGNGSMIKKFIWSSSSPGVGIIKPGYYYHLYESEITYKGLIRVNGIKTRVENNFGHNKLIVFKAQIGYTR